MIPHDGVYYIKNERKIEMPKKNVPPEDQTVPVENPVETVENPDENQIEPDANQTEPDAEHYATPEELVAAFLASPEYKQTIDAINAKLDKIQTIIRGVKNAANPPAEETPAEQNHQHIRRYL